MALDFPPNLDDGELWLPSDIISDVIGPHRRHPDFGLSDSYPHPNRSMPIEEFRPVTGFGFGYDGCRVQRSSGSYLHGSRVLQPVQAQMFDGFGQGKSRVWQRQQQQPQMGPERLYPFRVIRSGRVCGGTGVFFPRVISYEPKKKSDSMKNGEQEKQPLRNNKAATNQVVMPLMKSSSELSLPQEWTY